MFRRASSYALEQLLELGSLSRVPPVSMPHMDLGDCLATPFASLSAPREHLAAIRLRVL